MDILILRLSSMGDVILTAPLFSYLRREYPSCSLTFVTGAGYAQLFKDDPRLLETVGLSAADKELPSRIRARNWDLVIDLQNNKRSRMLLDQPAGASDRKTFNKLHWQRLVLLLFRCDVYPEKSQIASRYIDTIGDPRSTDVPPLRLYFNEPRESLFDRSGGIRRPALAIFPFSAWKNKEWPLGRYMEVGKYFHKKGWNIGIFGGPGDQAKAEIMSSGIGQRCISFAGGLSLYECGTVLPGFTLAIGNDTGLSHLSRACGVKTVVIFGPTTRQFGFYPYGEPPFRILESSAACRPCHAHGGNVCFRVSRPCMRRISVQRAIAELESLSGE